MISFPAKAFLLLLFTKIYYCHLICYVKMVLDLHFTDCISSLSLCNIKNSYQHFIICAIFIYFYIQLFFNTTCSSDHSSQMVYSTFINQWNWCKSHFLNAHWVLSSIKLAISPSFHNSIFLSPQPATNIFHDKLLASPGFSGLIVLLSFMVPDNFTIVLYCTPPPSTPEELFCGKSCEFF